MTAKNRIHQVQTPGEPAAKAKPDDTATTSTIQAPAADADQSESKDKDVQHAGATQAPQPLNRTKTNRPTAEQYKRMRADEVDPDIITAPVLTADGWVVPTSKEKA